MNEHTTAPENEIEPNRPAFEGQEGFLPEELAQFTDGIIAALKTVYDPEIPADIYELGLIYRVDIDDSQFVTIDMTLTAPGCPVAGTFPATVEERLREVPGVADVHVHLVWEPAWSMEHMPEAVKLQLGLL